MSLAHKYAATQATDPALTVIEPKDRNWFAVIPVNGQPRIALIEDWKYQMGGEYGIFRLMGCGTEIAMHVSNIMSYVWPPSILPKPVSVELFDEVRLVDHRTATIIDIRGDLYTIATDDGLETVARWDVLRVIEESGYGAWLDQVASEAVAS